MGFREKSMAHSENQLSERNPKMLIAFVIQSVLLVLVTIALLLSLYTVGKQDENITILKRHAHDLHEELAKYLSNE